MNFRRDFLEYRFGTIASASLRNYPLGGIPYYLFLGCHKESTMRPSGELERMNAALTESPYLSPKQYRENENRQALQSAAILSKACEAAVVNLSANLPLPSTFYQNHKWRVYYNDLLPKHTQFKEEYIYAFNWEDPRTDRHLLNINSSDVILAITSAGDNILDYLLESPRRVHAVDLNPNQNHLLELKVAAFTALPSSDVWKMFGEGRHPQFRELLVRKLSPHLSSQALQYWLEHTSTFTSKYGLYETGGSRYAIRGVRYLMRAFNLTHEVNKLLSAETLNEQREIWPKVRNVLLSWPLHSLVVNTEWFAWKAFGVPAAQRWLIQKDFADTTGQRKKVKEGSKRVTGEAMWQYATNTADPVAEQTMLSTDNYFYGLCLRGSYSEKCHPRYTSPKSHTKLSRPDAFEGLRIHTDSINEVIARIAPETLTIAVIMDSMDWFPHPTANDQKGLSAATIQVQALNRVLVTGKGRVLLRSAGLRPWYIDVFESTGFTCKCVGRRDAGMCIDRVNMYASTWICTKTADIGEAGAEAAGRIQRSGSRPSSSSSSTSSSSLRNAPVEQKLETKPVGVTQEEPSMNSKRLSTFEL